MNDSFPAIYYMMKPGQFIALSALVLACSLIFFANARPATDLHPVVRREWISDTCGQGGRAQVEQALNEAREMVKIIQTAKTGFQLMMTRRETWSIEQRTSEHTSSL